MMDGVKTWRWRRDLASWFFSIEARAGESATACLRRVLVALVEALPGFARLSSPTFTTRNHGERDVLGEPRPSLDALLDVFDQDDPVLDMIFGVELLVSRTVDGPEEWLWPCGFLSIGLEDASLDARAVDVTLTIDIDIYARDAGADGADNRPLARINGPRLAGFLAVLNGPLEARLVEVVSDGYDQPAEINAHGFTYE